MLAAWIHLKLNTTPKMHISMSHAIDFDGICGFRRGCRECTHQQESRNEGRVAVVKDIIQKENCKVQFDSMAKSKKVKMKEM